SRGAARRTRPLARPLSDGVAGSPESWLGRSGPHQGGDAPGGTRGGDAENVDKGGREVPPRPPTVVAPCYRAEMVPGIVARRTSSGSGRAAGIPRRPSVDLSMA